MPSNTWSQPAPTLGFDRSSCLASFAPTVSGVSGFGLLVNGCYEPGDVFVCDGTITTPLFISPSTDPVPLPTLFGDWVYNILAGVIPTATATGGLNLLGGAYGGANWINVAFSGIHSLQIQTQYGGTVGFDTTIPGLNYTVTGTETFGLEFMVVDNVPEQIFIQFFNATDSTWHGVYVGTNKIGYSLFNAGTIAPSIGSWQQILFTPADLGLTAGAQITGMSWGVWNTTTTASVLFSDTGNVSVGPSPGTLTPSGYVDCATDGNVGFFMLSNIGPLIQVPAVGATPVVTQLNTVPSFAYTGLVYNPVNGYPYFIGYDGTVYNLVGTAVNTIVSPPGGISAPARWLYTDGLSNLFTMFPSSNKIGTYNINSHAWIVTGTPFTQSFDTFSYAASVSGFIAAGTNPQALNVSASILDLAFSSNSDQLLVLDDTPALSIYETTEGGWSLSQTVSGLVGSPVHVATEPDGLQALVTDTTNNRINVITNLGGTWNKTSQVTVTAPSALAIFTSGITQAMVCQPTNNSVSILNKSGTTWAVSQTFTIPVASSCAVSKNGLSQDAIVANSTGVSFLHFNGAVWVTSGSVTVSPAPTLVAADSVATSSGLFYGVASSGADTIVYVFQNQTLVNQFTIAGDTLGTLAVVDYRIIVPSFGGNLNTGFYVSGTSGYTSQAGISPVLPIKALYLPTVTDFLPLLLIAGPHTIWSFYSNKTQSYARVTDSQVAILSGVTWQTIDVVNRNKVSSVTADPSGNVFAVTTDNNLYKWSSSGILASGYPYIVTPPTNQQEFVPLGLSKLLWWRNGLFCSSSLAGGIVVIEP